MPIGEGQACSLTERQKPGLDVIGFTDGAHFKMGGDAHGHNQLVYDREK